MAEITTKRTGELLRKLFEILMKSPDGIQAASAIDQLANSVTLTEYEKGNYESTGTRRFDKIVRFATVDCVKAGWLAKNKGIWTITQLGVDAYNHFPDPEKFYREATRLYRKWKAAQGSDEALQSGDSDAAPEKSASITFEQAEEQAWSEIELYLKSINPYDFQQLVADLLKAMGYFVAWVAPPGKDGGVDIVAHVDPLGTRNPRIKVQVKRYGSSKIDVDGVRSFLALINEDDVGLFVTLAGFTKDAESFARSQERRKITLVDFDRLIELWVEHYSKLDDVARNRLRLTPIYFLTPE